MTGAPPGEPPNGPRQAARDRLLAVVERQLTDGHPKEVGGTLLRLSFLGHSRDEAIRLIAVALTLEMRQMMAQGRPFDEKAYIAKLNLLPDLARLN
jgi:hypothetical protein